MVRHALLLNECCQSLTKLNLSGQSKSGAFVVSKQAVTMRTVLSCGPRNGMYLACAGPAWDGTNCLKGFGHHLRDSPQTVHAWIVLSVCGRSRAAGSAFGYSSSQIALCLCYSYFVLWKKGVRAPQAKTLSGLRSLARDCDSPHPHRISSCKAGSRAGCSGWKTRHRMSLAVQQQRFDKRQQC
jgi:hypothetical protein